MKTTNNLFKTYFFSSNEKLIKIVEYEDDYTKETVEVAKELLEGRALENNLINKIARNLMRKRLKHFFGSFNSWNDELKIPTSAFLSKDEVKKIFESEYNIYLSNRNMFRANLNMYMG